MRIVKLKVQNFRGIKNVELTDLDTMIVIAGTNGSGKSSIFDAIRLLKSVYGGYQQNEWHQWMGEFQVAVGQSGQNLEKILNNPTQYFEISATYRLSDSEKSYLFNNAEQMVRNSVWRTLAPELHGWQAFDGVSLSAHTRAREDEVNRLTAEQLPVLIDEISKDTIDIEFSLTPGDPIFIAPSKAMELLFGLYLPGVVGLFDYHGPQRFFNRESVQGITLNVAAHQQQQLQHAASALYNYNNKYSNVKTEMAASYVSDLLAEAAGVPRSAQSTITNTLSELFKTFFPDKKFEGPKALADGGLAFPVTMSDGAEHDLDDLSAGEKEILYGYLRIRNSAPKYSMILLDEPELHLNPKLVRSLPEFYRKYLGEALDNQIWLVTHSDALIREVVGQSEFKVFHMTSGIGASFSDNQAKPLNALADSERAVIDLVGDLAAYRPGGKVVIFEGGGDSKFDVHMATKLFPSLMQGVNAVSAGSKRQVRGLHMLLDEATSGSKIPFKVYSIADKDTDQEPFASVSRQSWDRYHIENYLLHTPSILKTLKSLEILGFETESEVYNALRESAKSVVPEVVRSLVTRHVSRAMTESINLKIDPNSQEISDLMHQAVVRSFERMTETVKNTLSSTSLENECSKLKKQFDSDFISGDWIMNLPGRSILTRFADTHTKIGYSNFRNLLLNRMADEGEQPEGMLGPLNAILSDV